MDCDHPQVRGQGHFHLTVNNENMQLVSTVVNTFHHNEYFEIFLLQSNDK